MILEKFSSPSCVAPCPQHWHCWRQIRGVPWRESSFCLFLLLISCLELLRFGKCLQKHGENITKTSNNNSTLSRHKSSKLGRSWFHSIGHKFIPVLLKVCWQGLPNYSRVWGVFPSVVKSEFTQLDHNVTNFRSNRENQRNIEVGSKGLDVTAQSDTFC